MRRIPVLLVASVAAGSLVGVSSAIAVARQPADEHSVSRIAPEDCGSGTIAAGSVLTRPPSDGGDVERSSPQELAERYVEDANLAADFPDVTTRVDQEGNSAATVSILSGVTVIGQLTYVRIEGSWATDTVQVCAAKDK